MDSRNRSGVGRWQIAVLSVVSHVMFFSRIGGISSKYSSFAVLRCEHVRVDGRTDGRTVCWLVTCPHC